jgi:hypothetical protein
MVVCHQPLAGASAVNNADEIQTLLATAADKIILVINGHSHIDDVLRIKNVTYMHVNSASYQWVGGTYRHDSYPKEVHDKYPWISYTCPYRDSVFATFTFDPQSQTIGVEGRHSEWVGKSPAELGIDLDPNLTNGEEISPQIRNRQLLRIDNRQLGSDLRGKGLEHLAIFRMQLFTLRGQVDFRRILRRSSVRLKDDQAKRSGEKPEAACSLWSFHDFRVLCFM